MELKRFRDYVSGSKVDPDSKTNRSLLEKGAEPYNCRAKTYRHFSVKRNKGRGRFLIPASVPHADFQLSRS